ncbi:MAG: 4-beta-xylosidase [Candidatus Ordinivivax streblomastigis]|uniref:4-beta-xylosidase n=1 Tax=Candidatus Ordinivivax streblomastigis TaxID=2540710 RepID=A0A5M8NYS9_9BACT|nr:MAG: 4-beta-xylosidase [Candidatus Ordinivivax streblomastigis]
MKKISIIVAAFLLVTNFAFGKDIYKDSTAPIHDRVVDLLSKLTIEEKVSLLRATSPGIPRLDIPKYYYGNEALHGIIRPGRFTVFPQAIGLAAMWNPSLHYQIATAISDEGRARWNALEQGKLQTQQFSDLLSFWSPTVNMARDPRWGRTPETYGEDPYLSGTLGTQFVKGLQGDDPRYLKVISTPKHFAANNEEHNRFECNPQISERQLREYYLQPFEWCIREGKAASIMSAYNAINDVPSTANPWLLTKVLREDWGFNGYVVSDCGAPGLLVWSHKYVKTKEAAATLCIKAGLDLECGDDIFTQPLLNAYNQYMVTQADIDTAAYRVLSVRMRLGMFDDPDQNPYTKISPEVIGSEKHKQLTLEAARQSIVLLKNQNKKLPLNPAKVKSIAVVGINAGECEFGDYSGVPVSAPVSVLQGIQDRVGDKVKIVYAPWVSAVDGREMISKAYFPEGLKTAYFKNKDFQGESKVRTEEWVNFEPANQAPDPFIPASPVAVRWTGKIHPNVSGLYTFYYAVDDGCRLFIDGKNLIDSWYERALSIDSASIYLEANKEYDLQAEYFNNRDNVVAKLYWKIPTIGQKERLEMYGEAGKAVKECEQVIAVVGTNEMIEREGQDRNDIRLPEDQMEFIKEIYKVNPNIVVVLVAGSPLAINWIDDNVPAIVNAWYPGEQGGRAVAEVLFGDYNPGGKLPVTYYNSLDELPPFDDYDITKGRTYQYFKGKPLYPFGYGLSYTTFKYSNLNIQDTGKAVSVSFDLKNTGKIQGDEVAQVYVKMPETGVVMPLKELKAFQRSTVKKGESLKVELEISKDVLRFWDDASKAFVTPAGEYQFLIGSSSSDIRLQGSLVIK